MLTNRITDRTLEERADSFHRPFNISYTVSYTLSSARTFLRKRLYEHELLCAQCSNGHCVLPTLNDYAIKRAGRQAVVSTDHMLLFFIENHFKPFYAHVQMVDLSGLEEACVKAYACALS